MNRSYYHQYGYQQAPNRRHFFNDQQRNKGYYSRDSSNSGDAHWCETCDRGFPNMAMLAKHKQQHQTCNIDGCQFVAHPKVITKHIQMQHSSGLFKKISNLQNPEDIKKWIDERKKKYPTKVNVEKKAAELKEKIERGEKMGLNCNKGGRNYKSTGENFKRKSFDKQHGNMRRNKRTKQTFSNNTSSQENKIDTKLLATSHIKTVISSKYQHVLPALDDSRKLKPFGGIRSLMDCVEIDDSKEEQCNYLIDVDDEIQETPSNEPTICGALSCLIDNYGSEEEIDSTYQECPKDQAELQNIKIKKCTEDATLIKPLSRETETVHNTDHENDQDDGPQEVKIVKNNDVEHSGVPEEPFLSRKLNKVHSKQKKYENACKRNIITKKVKPKVPSTLLQKLLQNEIRNERNTILQCIRFIIENKYFDMK